MDKDIHFLYFFFLDELERVEVLYFAGDSDGKVGYVEPGNRAHGTVAGQQIRPHLLLGIARAADRPIPVTTTRRFNGAPPYREAVSAFTWRASQCTRWHRGRW